jgi:uncharacterized protein
MTRKSLPALLEEVNPRTAPAVASGLIEAIGLSRSDAVGEAIVEEFASFTPSLKNVAVIQLLKRPTWTRALLKGIESGKATLTDLALDQKQALASHSDRGVRDQAKRLMEQGGAFQMRTDKKCSMSLHTSRRRRGCCCGKLAFTTHCSKCHVHSGEGANVGPILPGWRFIRRKNC